MNILLAEDDLKLGKLMKYMLQDEGHKVNWVTRGSEALSLASDFVYDVIILDWMLPDLDGIALCRQLRSQDYHKPILMLTAKDAVSDRVTGLDAGADDYLTKPFEFSELFARLRALSRRSDAPIRDEIIRLGELELNRTARTAQRGTHLIQLTTREFKLLDLLVQNRGHVLPREVILDRVWGLYSEVSENNVDAYIRLLRKKIEVPGGRTLIHTVRGLGYKVEA
jgi:DNA-binding response OmpR family regulator